MDLRGATGECGLDFSNFYTRTLHLQPLSLYAFQCNWSLGYQEAQFISVYTIDQRNPPFLQEYVSTPMQLRFEVSPDTLGGESFDRSATPTTGDKLGEMTFRNESLTSKREFETSSNPPPLTWAATESDNSIAKSRNIRERSASTNFKKLARVRAIQGSNININTTLPCTSKSVPAENSQEQRHLLTIDNSSVIKHANSLHVPSNDTVCKACKLEACTCEWYWFNRGGNRRAHNKIWFNNTKLGAGTATETPATATNLEYYTDTNNVNMTNFASNISGNELYFTVNNSDNGPDSPMNYSGDELKAILDTMESESDTYVVEQFVRNSNYRLEPIVDDLLSILQQL